MGPNTSRIAQEIVAEARKMSAETKDELQKIADDILRSYGLSHEERQDVKRILDERYGVPVVPHPSER